MLHLIFQRELQQTPWLTKVAEIFEVLENIYSFRLALEFSQQSRLGLKSHHSTIFTHFRAWNLREIGKRGKIRISSEQNIWKPPGRRNRANSITLKFCIKRRISLSISLARGSRSSWRFPSWGRLGSPSNVLEFCCVSHVNNTNILEITVLTQCDHWNALTTLEPFSSSAPCRKVSDHLSMISFTTRHSRMNLLTSCKFTVTVSVINLPHVHRFWLANVFVGLKFFVLLFRGLFDIFIYGRGRHFPHNKCSQFVLFANVFAIIARQAWHVMSILIEHSEYVFRITLPIFIYSNWTGY